MNPVRMRLAKRKTEDGLFEFKGDIPLGKEYLVDLDSKRRLTFFNTEQGIYHVKMMIRDMAYPEGEYAYYLPFDLLEKGD